jgi:hypothetical protein
LVVRLLGNPSLQRDFAHISYAEDDM